MLTEAWFLIGVVHLITLVASSQRWLHCANIQYSLFNIIRTLLFQFYRYHNRGRHCTMCSLSSMLSFQPNKLGHILKFMSWYIIQHIFVPACLVGRKTWFSRKPWLSHCKFGISGSFWLILSVSKIMFLVRENEKRKKF